MWHRPVREYLEYWSSTCQVGKIEYLSPHTELDGVPNLSALKPVEINLYLANPKGYGILCKPGNAYCFSFKDEQGNTGFYSDYSEAALEHNTTIKVQAMLPDDTEGQTITLTGCIWPDNRSSLGFSEEQLLESFPELFYTTTFVQNTPPDNVKNMNSSGPGDFYTGTQKHYLSFDIPNLSLKRNHGSRYEIKTYLRETDGELYYKGSEIVSLDDSDPGNRTYLYYYGEQEDRLFYEYTVQVLGPHGLKSELLATDERLGVHQLTEPTITILNELNGLEDEDGFKCIEVATNDGSISYAATPAHEDDTLTVTVNDVEVTDGNFTISGIGQYTIKATSSKDGSRPIYVTEKIRIVKTPDPATFTFASDDTTDLNGFNGFTDTNGFEYLEVPAADSTVRYSISPTEEGTTVSGTVDETEYSEPIDTETLDVGPHTLVAVIHKQYCNDVTTTRKIMVAKSLEEPVYTFNPNLNGKKVGDFEYLEVSSSTAKASYTVKPSTADGNAKVSSNAGSIQFNATAQKTGQLGPGDYTFTVTVSKDYMISRTFTKYLKVDSKLTPPEIAFTSPAPNGKRDELYEYIEVDNSSSKASYTVNNNESRDGTTVSTVVTAMPNNTQVSTSNSGNLDAGIPGSPKKYMIVATVTKDGYVEQSSTKFVAVVAKLKTPQITFGSAFNGKGQDSDGYYYIELSNATDTVSYLSSTEDNDGTNNPVNLTTKINGLANNTIGSLGIGDYEIEVTAHRPFQDDVTFTQKVRVVQELQEPTYSISPNFTSKTLGGFECVEVSSSSGKATLTITAASGCTLSGTNNSTSFSSSTNTQTFTLGTGEYTITGSVNKTNCNSKTFTKKIKVVESLKEPTYSISPNFTGKSLSGYECVEVSSSTGTADLTITAATGCTLSGTKNGTSFTSSSNTYMLTLGIGEYTISGYVNKTGYNSKAFTKKIKVIQELQEPTIKVYKHDGNDLISPSSSAPEQSGYSDYTCYDLPLTTSGTGHANFEVYPASDNGSVSVKIDGTTVNAESNGKRYLKRSSGDNHLGGYTVTLTVKKDGYKPQEFTKKVYVQGILSDPKISPNNGTFDSGSGNTSSDPMVYQFSYISYDSMKLKFEPGNSNSGGTSTSLSWKINDLDGTNTTGIQGIGVEETVKIEIKQTRQYCKTKPTTKYAKGIIKPIKLKYHNARGSGQVGDARICLGGISGVGSFDLLGEVKINNQTIWGYGSNKYGVGTDQWDHLNTDTDERGYEETLYTPNDTIKLELINMKRRPDKESFGSHDVTKKLSEIKGYTIPTIYPYGGKTLEPPAGTSNEWIIYTGRKTCDKRYIYVYVKFSVSD